MPNTTAPIRVGAPRLGMVGWVVMVWLWAGLAISARCQVGHLGADDDVVGAVAGEGEGPPTPLLVASLSSASFRERQQAMTELWRAGSQEVVAALLEAVANGTPEAGERSLELLLQMSLDASRPELRERATAGLQELAGSKGGGAVRALAVLGRRAAAMESIARARLRDAGAVVSSPSTRVSIQVGKKWHGLRDDLAYVLWVPRVQRLTLEGSSVTDEMLGALHGLRDVTYLYLGETALTAHGVEQLGRVESVQYLSLRGLQLGGLRRSHLEQFPQATKLGLDNTDVGDDDLGSLEALPQLETLWLNNTQVTDAGVVRLGAMEKLSNLYLPETKVDGSGLEVFAKRGALRYLSLRMTRLSPEGVRSISALRGLTTLELDGTNLTDEHLPAITGLESLSTLWLSQTELSDASIPELAKLVNLRRLNLRQTKVSAEGLKRLREALPKCSIQH